MTLTPEGVKQAFAERVGRPITDDVAQKVADSVGEVIDDLNAIDPAPMFLIEPNIVFDASYPEGEGSSGWQRSGSSSSAQSVK